MLDKKVSSLAGKDGSNSADTTHSVRITSTSRASTPIKAYLPDTVSLTVASDWSAPFADATEGKLNTLASLFGASLKTRASTAQIWQGSTPIEVTIPFVLTAETDPAEEIMFPISELMKLCLPAAKDGRFLPPGPNFKSYLLSHATSDSSTDKTIRSLAKNSKKIGAPGESITVEVGKFMVFDRVVLLSVSPTFSTQRLHHSGLPLKAEVEITFRKYTTSVKDEVDRMLDVAQARLSVIDAAGTPSEKTGIFPSTRNKIDKLTKKVPLL